MLPKNGSVEKGNNAQKKKKKKRLRNSEIAYVVFGSIEKNS